MLSKIKMKIFLISSIGLLSLSSLLFSSLALANTNKVKLYDVIAHFPAPSWTTAKDQLAKSEVKRKQTLDSLALEFIPKGQSFDSWSAMSSIYTWQKPSKDMDWFFKTTVAIYTQACGVENVKIDLIEDNPQQKLLTIYCQKLIANIPEYGYATGVGEIAVIHLENNGNIYVKNYHAWRGPTFDYTKPDTWPIDNATIKKSQISLEDAKITGY